MKILALVTAAAVGLGLTQAAQADLSGDVAQDRKAVPPVDYEGQWWTHPKGCEYSRAGRPGEVIWYLIINTAKRGCPKYIVGHTSYRDVY
ncbi:hypothetical protein [Roseovarius aestuariivivens]|uniref:hypothetical protein n=1 Tax=Roseovarius aestuariivivens TaxID=1888910 RepID=UPI001080BFDC|nr:hypothetical protein [Roseovarius aestuariivivens]